jgi:DNA-binding transcriptional LysR family regulator
MTRRQIAYFLSVASHRSFSRAAEHLHVAQSALSARIAELERSLGRILFVRHSHGVTLTEAGQTLLPYAKEIEAAFERASRAILAPTVEKNSFRLGVTPSVGSALLSFLLEATNELRPDVDWQVQQTISVNLINMLEKDEIAAAICFLKVSSPKISCFKVHSEDMALIGLPSIIGDVDADIAFSELPAFKFVLDPRINPRRQIVDAAMSRMGIDLPAPAEIEPLSVKRVLMRDKGLCAILPRRLFVTDVAEGFFSARRIVSPKLTLTMYLLLSKSLDKSSTTFIRKSIQNAVALMAKAAPTRVGEALS